VVSPSEALDALQVLVPGGALAALLYHLCSRLGHAAAFKLEERSRRRTRVAEIEAEAAREVAVIEAASRARVREMRVEQELRLALEQHRTGRPRRQLEPVRPPPSGRRST
jgi:hypothetical protein